MQKNGILTLLAFFSLILVGCTTINELASEVASCKISDGYDVSCVRNLALQKNDPNICTRVLGEDSLPEMTCVMEYARIKNDKYACNVLAKETAEVCRNSIS